MSDSWEGQLGAEAAGQPSEKMPDFIPGWFRRIGTRKGEQIREAVRIIDPANFPLSFLRGDEFVRPAVPGRHGVTIGRIPRDMELAVPPGYWIVRDDDGELHNWRDVDFRDQFVRENRLWVALADRPRLDDVAEPLDNEATPPWLRPDEQDMWQESRFDNYRVLLRRISNLRAREGRRELEDRAAVAEANRIASSRDTAAEDQLTAKREELIEIHRFLDELGAPCGPEISSPTALRRLRAWKGIVLGDGEGAEKIVSRDGDGMQPGDVGEIEDPDAPDAEIFAADGANIGGLHVVLGAQDGVPYVSLVELEHLFANLYEDITDRQAKKDTAEKKASPAGPNPDYVAPHCPYGSEAPEAGHCGHVGCPYHDIPGSRPFAFQHPLTPDEVERIEKQKAAAVIDEEHRVDAEDDRPLWRVELDYGLNHLHNAVTDWLGL